MEEGGVVGLERDDVVIGKAPTKDGSRISVRADRPVRIIQMISIRTRRSDRGRQVFRGVREEGTKDGELAERSHHEERTVNRRSGPERNATIEATIIGVKRITWIGGIVSSWRRQRGSANQSHGY